VDPARGKADDPVADAHPGAVDQLVRLDDADTETHQLVVPFSVESGHLGRLPSQQGASGILAALHDTFDELPARLDVDRTCGDVVKEKEGFGALYDDVVDGHGDKVDADRVVSFHHPGDVELGPYAVGRGHEDGVTVFGPVEVKEAPETAEAAHYLFSEGRLDERLDHVDETVALIDVDPGVLI